jgi:hypothetical protein
MSQGSEFLTQLVRTALGRQGAANPDGGAPATEAAALISSHNAAEREPEDSDRDEDRDRNGGFDPGVICVLSEKVLMAWLRNRYQLMFPFALDLRRLDREQAKLLVHTMVAAAQADGAFDGSEHKRIEGTLGLVDAADDARAFMDEALKEPKPLNEILAGVKDVQTGALVYAASLMALDERKPANRYYLKYLAARLQLSDELVLSLEQRYRAAN